MTNSKEFILKKRNRDYSFSKMPNRVIHDSRICYFFWGYKPGSAFKYTRYNCILFSQSTYNHTTQLVKKIWMKFCSFYIYFESKRFYFIFKLRFTGQWPQIFTQFNFYNFLFLIKIDWNVGLQSVKLLGITLFPATFIRNAIVWNFLLFRSKANSFNFS